MIIVFKSQSFAQEETAQTSDPFSQQTIEKMFQSLSVTARTAQVFYEPDKDSSLVVFLKSGDRVDLIEEKEAWLRVRYLLEGEFPLEGWILKDATNFETQAKLQKQKLNPNYTPKSRDRTQVVTEVQDLPEKTLPEEVEAPQKSNPTDSSKTAQKLSTGASSPSLFSKKRLGQPYPKLYTGLEIGASQFQETSTNKGENSAFVDYEISGVFFRLSTEAQWSISQYKLGSAVHYAFHYFDGDLGGTDTNVVESSIQAQLHEGQIGGFVLRSFHLGKSLRFIPRLSLSAAVDLFTTNQLRTETTGFPVLFGFWSAQPQIQLIPQLELPAGLTLKPEIRLIPFYMFRELDTQTVNDQRIGTGSPTNSFFQLGYGAELSWRLNSIRLYGVELQLRYFIQEVDREFSDFGNRAGLQTEEVRSEIKKQEFSLGFRYLF